MVTITPDDPFLILQQEMPYEEFARRYPKAGGNGSWKGQAINIEESGFAADYDFAASFQRSLEHTVRVIHDMLSTYDARLGID